MPAVVIDATGNLNAINTAFQCIAHGGRFVLIGPQNVASSFQTWLDPENEVIKAMVSV